jgi:hypothetical protein
VVKVIPILLLFFCSLIVISNSSVRAQDFSPSNLSFHFKSPFGPCNYLQQATANLAQAKQASITRHGGCPSGGPEPPTWNAGEPKFQSWFDDCQNHINKVWKNDPFGRQITDAVGCTFFLKPDGNIEDLFVYTLGDAKNSDLVAPKIVQKSAPFVNPPEFLTHGTRMSIVFNRLPDGRCDSKLLWDGYDYSRINGLQAEVFGELKKLHEKDFQGWDEIKSSGTK